MARKANEYNVARDADLEASGLNDPKVLKKLRFGDVLNPTATADRIGIDSKRHRLVAYEIPYFDLDGAPTPYSRWKIISLGSDPAPLKYYQDDGTIPRIYFPPLVNWKAIADDVGQRIYITEGEKKSACACLHELPCLGLAGVWNWRSKKWNLDMIPDFDRIRWPGREVEICFDADMATNEHVARAVYEITAKLVGLGARVYVRQLANVGGKKGLDDFLVANGRDTYLELPCSQADTSRLLWEMNDDLVYVESEKLWYSTRTRIPYGKLEHLRNAYLETLPSAGRGSPRPAVVAWAHWPLRRSVSRITYEPERPVIFDCMFNAWRPSGVEAKRGDIKSFARVVTGFGTAEFQRHFWQWLAYPLQHPGAKINWAVVLWSVAHGTGKSFVGDVMREVYGDDASRDGSGNAITIGVDDLYGSDYTWLRYKQFVVAEEVTRGVDRRTGDKLKHLITGSVVRVNEKFVPRFSIPNRANILFCSNHSDALHIEEADRRYAVAEVHNDPLDAKLWSDAGRWRESGGAAALKWHLLHEVDCSEFDPKAHAPDTDDKRAMVYAGKTEIERWAADLMTDPDATFGDVAKAFRGRDVFTVEQLFHFVPEKLQSTTNTTALGKALTRMGAVRPTVGGGVIKVLEGTRRRSQRVVAIRNLDKWRERRDEEQAWKRNFEQHNPALTVIDGGKTARSGGGEQ